MITQDIDAIKTREEDYNTSGGSGGTGYGFETLYCGEDSEWIYEGDIDRGWIPIGTSDEPFTGTFDGNGHKIKNLFIGRSQGEHQGFWGYIKGATISNIDFENIKVVAGDKSAAVVASCEMSTMTNVNANGHINLGMDSGGITAITNCSEITSCHFQGKIFAGKYSGAISGGYRGFYNYFEDCTADGVFDLEDYSGGLFSRIDYSYIINCNLEGEVFLEGWRSSGFCAYLFDSKMVSCSCNAKINVKETSRLFGGLVGQESDRNSVSYIENSHFQGEISFLSEDDSHSSVGGLVGSTGHNCRISNCYSKGKIYIVDRVWEVGGFAGVCRGLIKDSYSEMIIEIGSASEMGGFVGFLPSSIYNCYSKGSIVSNGDIIGGFAGQATRSINKCYSEVDIQGEGEDVGGFAGTLRGQIINSYSIGDVEGKNKVGGFVGHLNSYTFTRSQITNSYSAGNVQGESEIGGLVGLIDGDIESSYFDAETSGQVGEYGISTSNMYKIDTFVNWDFETVWDIDEGESYPYFLVDTTVKIQIEQPKIGSIKVNGILNNRIYIDADETGEIEVEIEYIPEPGYVFSRWLGIDSDENPLTLTTPPETFSVLVKREVEDLERFPWGEVPDFWWDTYENKDIIDTVWRSFKENQEEMDISLKSLSDSRSILSAPYKIEKRWKKFEWDLFKSNKAIAEVTLYFDEIVSTIIQKGDVFYAEQDNKLFRSIEEVRIFESKMLKNRNQDGEMLIKVNVEAISGGEKFNGVKINTAKDYGQIKVEGFAHSGSEEEKIRGINPLNNVDGYLMEVPELITEDNEIVPFKSKVIDSKIHFVKSNSEEEIDYSILESMQPLNLWAPKYYIHNEMITKTLAPLVGFNNSVFRVNKRSELYFNMVKALWFMLVNGPTIKNIEASLYIVFGLPLTYHKDTKITKISHHRDQIWTETGERWHFDENFEPYNYEKNRSLEEGDIISESFTPIIKGPRIEDYINFPEWWIENRILPQGSDVGKYTFCNSSVPDNVFFGRVADVSVVARFLNEVFPSYANMMTNLIVRLTNPEGIGWPKDLPRPPIDDIVWPPEELAEPYEGTKDPDSIGDGGIVIGIDDDGNYIYFANFGSKDIEVEDNRTEEGDLFQTYIYKFLDGPSKFNNFGVFEQLRHYKNLLTHNVKEERYLELKEDILDLEEDLKDAVFRGYQIEEVEETLESLEKYFDTELNFDLNEPLEYYSTIEDPIIKAIYCMCFLGGIPPEEINGQHGIKHLSFDDEDVDRFSGLDDDLKIMNTLGEEIIKPWKIQ